uniref:Uncharacterized protein n=1 Tax=Kalanchoe fedtschenkoi TaxID=63787 RepID=A0A7N1A627_KALFE
MDQDETDATQGCLGVPAPATGQYKVAVRSSERDSYSPIRAGHICSYALVMEGPGMTSQSLHFIGARLNPNVS